MAERCSLLVCRRAGKGWFAGGPDERMQMDGEELKMERKISIRKMWSMIFLAIFSAIGLTCGVDMDAWCVSGEGLEGYGVLASFLARLERSLSAERILPFLIAFLMVFLIKEVRKREFQSRDRVLAAIFAVCFSGMQFLGKSYSICDSWGMLFGGKFVFLRALLIILGASVPVYYLILFAFHFMEKVSGKENTGAGVFSGKYFVTAALLVFLCWLPYFILFFPGTSGNDTASQIAQFFGQSTWTRKLSAVRGKDIYLSNHFPFFTTVLAGVFVKVGVWLGNAAVGVALYVLLQMIFMAFTLSGVWFYLRWAGLSRRCMKAGLFFTAFFPLYPMYAICMLKDTAFGVFCLILSVLLLEIVRSKGACLKKKLFCAGFALDSLLIMLFRSQGVYMMLVVLVVILTVYRRYWIAVVASLLLPILLFQFVWIGVLLPMWKVAPGGRQEMLGILFQQTARYVKQYPEEVTPEEKEAIDGVIDYEKLAEKYNPQLTDPVKYTFRQDCTSQELAAYLNAWFGMLLRHPGTYIEAVLNNCYGFFYLDQPSGMVYRDFKQKSHWKEEGVLSFEAPFLSETVLQAVQMTVDTLQRIPIVNLLFSVGMYAWIVVYFVLDMIRKRNYAYLIPGLMSVLSTGILLICPANGNFRYIMPLIYAAPFLIGLCILRGEG